MESSSHSSIKQGSITLSNMLAFTVQVKLILQYYWLLLHSSNISKHFLLSFRIRWYNGCSFCRIFTSFGGSGDDIVVNKLSVMSEIHRMSRADRCHTPHSVLKNVVTDCSGTGEPSKGDYRTDSREIDNCNKNWFWKTDSVMPSVTAHVQNGFYAALSRQVIPHFCM